MKPKEIIDEFNELPDEQRVEILEHIQGMNAPDPEIERAWAKGTRRCLDEFELGETASELVLRLPGGFTNTYDIDEIASREQMVQSQMPAMQSSMTEDELIDLVEYLSTLQN